MSEILCLVLGFFVGLFYMKHSAEKQFRAYLDSQLWMNRKAGIQ